MNERPKYPYFEKDKVPAGYKITGTGTSAGLSCIYWKAPDGTVKMTLGWGPTYAEHWGAYIKEAEEEKVKNASIKPS